MSAKQNRKKRRKPTNWDAKLDKLWSLLVKHRAGWRCEYCGSREKMLNSHHIYSRSNRSTRWDLTNGVCLCVGHHTFSTEFSAHKTPTEFTEWLYKEKGEEFMSNLRVQAHAIAKLKPFEKEELYNELLTIKEEIELKKNNDGEKND
jgi:hypothetical protein